MSRCNPWSRSLLALLLLTACGDQVHIRLTPSLEMRQECDLAAIDVRSAWIELNREDADEIRPRCVERLPGGMLSLLSLEKVLGTRVAFEEIAPDSRWTIWATAFGSEDCSKAAGAPLLCGSLTGVRLPPDGGDEIALPVTCVSKHSVWDPETLKTCRIPNLQ